MPGGEKVPAAVERALEVWLGDRGLERADLEAADARVERVAAHGWSLVIPYEFADGSRAPDRLLTLEGKDGPAWRWSGGDVKGAVLRLGDPHAARLVVVAEGESDGLRAFGLLNAADPSIAVVVVPGASMVGDDLANWIGNGASVVIATDADEAGDGCAAACARILTAAGCPPDSVRRLRPEVPAKERPDLRDLIDHLAATCSGVGEMVDEFLGRLEAAPPVEVAPASETEGAPPVVVPASLITPWPEFDRLAAGGMAYRIEGLLPREGLGFTASSPKKGKTWLALAKGIAVATGGDFLGRFEVVERCPVIYVAMEGSPGGIRARIGALARGMGVDPDGADFRDSFHLAYKPRGLNLSDPRWAAQLIADAERVEAGLVIVDVLRRAASVRESADGVGDFAGLIRNLEPLIDGGHFLEILHHFRKEGAQDENAATAERMSGSGSLWGHYDAATFVTSGDGRSMQVEIDGRDFRPPRPFGVELQGEATGPWGYVYEDAVRLVATDARPRRVTKAPAEEIRAFIVAAGGSAGPGPIKEYFGITDGTLRDRREELAAEGVVYVPDLRNSRYEIQDQGQLL